MVIHENINTTSRSAGFTSAVGSTSSDIKPNNNAIGINK
jgi:hypothetical protein